MKSPRVTRPVPPRNHLSRTEAAEYPGVSVREIDRCLNSTDPREHIPSATVGETRTKRLIRRADLDAWFYRHMD